MTLIDCPVSSSYIESEFFFLSSRSFLQLTHHQQKLSHTIQQQRKAFELRKIYFSLHFLRWRDHSMCSMERENRLWESLGIVMIGALP